MLHCVIVDDEPLAREGIAGYVKEIDFLQLVETCDNAIELVSVLDRHTVDLVFLDIQMPKMNGLDFLATVQKPPMVIVTTAFPGYALEGFRLNVMDYLLKPITFDRFFKAAHKAKSYQQLLHNNTQATQPPAEVEPDYFFVKCSNTYEKIFFNDILCIEAMQNYVTIFTSKGKYITLLLLKNVEENLDRSLFIRVHKSYIVPINKIESIEGNEIKIQSHRIPISRNYREQVLGQVVKNKLWIK